MSGELILVIEDNERNRKLVCEVLDFAGLRVISAATADEGLMLANQRRPDLILMDIGLPGTDGVAALRSLRSEELTAHIPVVAVTAYAMQGDRQSLLTQGFDGYIPKPIDVKVFGEQVVSFLKDTRRERLQTSAVASTPILVVDDVPANARLLEAMLTERGYEVVVAGTGTEALAAVAAARPSLILLDVQLPDIDGYEICRRLRTDATTAAIPIVMITASEIDERLAGLEAGADDFVTKPFNQLELLARIRSLVKIGAYRDQIQAQADELAELNRTLQQRVLAQVDEMERLGRLRRFVSPQVADAIMSAGDERPLSFHRSEIAALFCDLRGFTSFAGNSEPEESANVMAEYHGIVGSLVAEFEATVGHFAGDGIMLFFNDPVPCPEPAACAVRMALALRDQMAELTERWRKRGHELGFGIGISYGFATVGEMGFEGRRDYGAIGSVCNLASRLCDEAADGQVLVGPRTYLEVENVVEAERVPDLELKGFSGTTEAYSVIRMTSDT